MKIYRKTKEIWIISMKNGWYFELFFPSPLFMGWHIIPSLSVIAAGRDKFSYNDQLTFSFKFLILDISLRRLSQWYNPKANESEFGKSRKFKRFVFHLIPTIRLFSTQRKVAVNFHFLKFNLQLKEY